MSAVEITLLCGMVWFTPSMLLLAVMLRKQLQSSDGACGGTSRFQPGRKLFAPGHPELQP